jgi:hypothetical protein
MELIASDVEVFHCGFADLDALAVAVGIEGAFDLAASLVVGAPISSTTARRSVNGRPRQFSVM